MKLSFGLAVLVAGASAGEWEADRRNEQDLENDKFPMTRKNLFYKGPIVKHTPVVAEGFNEHKWACKNGARYVNFDQLCNGKDDCGDNSDEALCGDSEFTNYLKLFAANSQRDCLR